MEEDDRSRNDVASEGDMLLGNDDVVANIQELNNHSDELQNITDRPFPVPTLTEITDYIRHNYFVR